MGQIDYVLASHKITPYITSYKTRDNIGSDHEALEYIIDFSNFTAPPKPFRFNDNDLRDATYRHTLENIIDTEVSKSVIHTGNKSFHESATNIKDQFLQKLNYSKLENRAKKHTYTQTITNILESVTTYSKQYHKEKR